MTISNNTNTVLSPCTMLHTRGTDIINSSEEVVILKGAAIGGMLNMENFITGYAGHEHEHRAQMASVLGEENAQFFFDRLLHHFFTDADAALYASLGLNCLRIPFNYRHFFDDMDPDTLKPDGFAWLDRCVDICARHNIYAILDLHAVPGGQNQDWHCDSGISRAAFWDFKDHQDRVIRLWEVIASRYAGNPVVAGYNPLNEPADPTLTSTGRPGARLLSFYERVEKAIRTVDREHMLFLDGNTYAMDFTAFEDTPPLPNTVYAIHDYSKFGFPSNQEQYTGTETQKARLRASLDRKCKFMRDAGVPIWNGEFGPVYQDPRVDGPSAKGINAGRIALLEEQLRLYRESGISWSIWLYKDIGYQGMTFVDPESAYMRLIRPFLEKKQRLGLDCWTIVSRDAVKGVYEPFLKAMREMVDPKFREVRYPFQWTLERQFERVVRECLLSEYVGWEMAELFRGKSREELEVLAGCFNLKNCKVREDLVDVLRRDAMML